jgi:hypothetical protein
VDGADRTSIDTQQSQHNQLTCGAPQACESEKHVMAQSVDPTDREKPDRLSGIPIPTN